MFVEVDGSQGEGGGQILRGAVALSCITGKQTNVFSIRAKRPKPGLQPQHLISIEAAAKVSGGRVEGLEVGSPEIRFTPGQTKAGKYDFDIRTAGSVTLVMQTLLPILALADGESEVVLGGGTDVPWSPPIDYMRHAMIPSLAPFGIKALVEVQGRGHYPKGGGRATLRVCGVKEFSAIRFIERGKVESIRGVSHCSSLPPHIAARQAEAARKVLSAAGFGNVRIAEESGPAASPGSGITLWAEAGYGVRIGADALGAREKRAEDVGREAAEGLAAEIRTGMAADRHFGNMAVLYMALANGTSELGVSSLTRHSETMMWLCNRFLGVQWSVRRQKGGGAILEVNGVGGSPHRNASLG